MPIIVLSGVASNREAVYCEKRCLVAMQASTPCEVYANARKVESVSLFAEASGEHADFLSVL